METVITSFFGAPTLVLCIIIYLLVYGMRVGCEWVAGKLDRITPDSFDLRVSYWWRSVVLPVLPFVVGVAVMWFGKDYPVPEPFNTSVQGMLAFGLVCGGASGFVYRFARESLKKLVAQPSETPKES